MKLELKHLAPYLPYNLRVKTRLGEINTIVMLGRNSSELFGKYDDYPFNVIKPILKPLSNLAKEEYWKLLLQLLIDRDIYKNPYHSDHNDYKARIIKKPFGKIFKLQNHDDWVLIISLSEPDRTKALVYNWLLENHFDVFGLIDKGLAVDINTLKEANV